MKRSLLLTLALILAAPLPTGAAGTKDLSSFREEIRTSEIRGDGAVVVQNLNIETGLASIFLRRGTLFPGTSVNGRVAEMVFLGEGELRAQPPDEIEAGQLDLFLGQREVRTAFEEAVFVVTRDEAASILFDGREAAVVDTAGFERARDLFLEWRDGGERRQFRVQSALLRDAAGDSTMETFFAAWFRDEELGDYLYLVDPEEIEQVTLGQWVPIDTTTSEERKIRRQIHSQQRRGRLVGFELEDLGAWETWLSTPLRNDDGTPDPGRPTFDTVHYEIDLSIAPITRETTATATLTMTPMVKPGIAATLRLSQDFEVSGVTDADGEALFFHREGGEIAVVLPEPVGVGEEVTLRFQYAGNPLEKARFHLFTLRDTSGWYPSTGSLDRATFDVTLHFPRKYQVLASGELVDSGDEGRTMKWVRRELRRPSWNFSFEMGDFDIEEEQAGHVAITLGFDRESKKLPDEIRAEIRETVRESLLYYEEIFGPYPLDHLTVVTVPRMFSQGFLGFITLSDLMLTDMGILRWYFNLEDRRTVIAHEVAHQWWANVVGWRSYRDQWLSEATANYASLLYARNRLDDEKILRKGPTTDWRRELMDRTEDGRTIESLGPLVLGERLNSVQYGAAYVPIVYTKGAMVLETLARFFQEDQFVQMLGHLVKAATGKDISTEDFIGAIERMSGAQLGWFRDRYLYGTGLPEVDYTYEFEERDEGGWRVAGTAEQRPTFHYRYQAVELPSGHDVLREREEKLNVAESNLIVPFQLLTRAAAEDDATDEASGKTSEFYGRMLLTGESTSFEFEVDAPPVKFWLDRRGEALATFYCESRRPKRVVFFKGLTLAAAGRFEEAEALLRQALKEPTRRDPDPENLPSEEILAEEAREMDWLIRFYLVQLYLDQDQDDRANETLQGNLDGMTKQEERQYGPFIRNLESRLELRRGEYAEAYKRLRRPVLIKYTDRNTESIVLLAIAARETDHRRDFEKALEMAENRGADVSLLASADSVGN